MDNIQQQTLELNFGDYCACGCGKPISRWSLKYRPTARYVAGHATRALKASYAEHTQIDWHAKELTRFWSFVEKVDAWDGCWLWVGTKTPAGYGRFHANKRGHVYAHRYSFELHNGSIPDGLVLDHLCRNPACINPCHLEPVTERTNILRGVGQGAQNAAKTHCKYGHPLTEENVKLTNFRGVVRRSCKECIRRRSLEQQRQLAQTDYYRARYNRRKLSRQGAGNTAPIDNP